MAKKDAQKILRVGIIQNDTVLEERLLRKRETITIGTTPKCTFIVPIPALKKPVPLIQVHKGNFWLNLLPDCRGRLSVGGQVMKLEDASKSPKTVSRGDSKLIELDENSRGKVRLHDLTVLFQFVTPPPVLPKPQLPASARGSIRHQIDYALLSFLLASALLLGGGVGSLHYRWDNYWVYQEGRFDVSTRVIEEQLVNEIPKIEFKKKDEPEPEEEAPEEAQDAQDFVVKKDPPKKVRKRRVRSKPAAASGKKSRVSAIEASKARAKRVRSSTLLRYLGSDQDGSSGLGPNTLKKGVTGERLADAWDTAGSVRGAKSGEAGGFQGGPRAGASGKGSYARISGKDVSGSRLGKGKVGRTKRGGGEKRIKLRIDGSLGNAVGLGKVDRGQVAKIFRRRKSAIQYCYKKALNRNPNVQGKISVQFTIGPMGRITKIRVVSNSTGDSSMEQCIVGKVRTWRFPKPQGGSVTFQYPFVLRKG